MKRTGFIEIKNDNYQEGYKTRNIFIQNIATRKQNRHKAHIHIHEASFILNKNCKFTSFQHRRKMKVRNILVFLLASCLLNSCLVDKDETVSLVAIPEQFLSGWNMAIKCSANSYDEVRASFAIEDQNSFTATSPGEQYYGDNYKIVFCAYYNPNSDSITGTVTFTDPLVPRYGRVCQFGLKWDSYFEEYIPLTTTSIKGGEAECWDQIKISFNTQYAH